MQEAYKTRVWSLSWEDPLEKEMATHSSILAWKTPWTEEPGRLQSMGFQRVKHYWEHMHECKHIMKLQFYEVDFTLNYSEYLLLFCFSKLGYG